MRKKVSDLTFLEKMNEKPPPPYNPNPPMAGFAQPMTQMSFILDGWTSRQRNDSVNFSSWYFYNLLKLNSYQPQVNQPLPGQPQVVQVVHTQQVVHTKPAPFGRDPVPTVCPHCSQTVSLLFPYGRIPWTYEINSENFPLLSKLCQRACV